MNEWINVKEKLPEPHKRVLLCSIIGTIKKIIVGYYDGQNFRYNIDDLWMYTLPFIAFWRELPKMPGESEENDEIT